MPSVIGCALRSADTRLPQAGKLASDLKAPHKHVLMKNADGAGEHTATGAMRLLHQTIFEEEIRFR